MAGRLRLLAVPLLLVLVPCAAIGAVGYQWLRLERAQESRRSQEAAVDEAVRLRADLLAHLMMVAERTSLAWRGRETGSLPFASPPAAAPLVADAYRFTAAGGLLYPNYERAYRDLIRQHETGTALPAWRRGFDRLETAEAQRDRQIFARELAQLRAIADTPSLVASLWLAEGRLALARSDATSAERAAGQVLGCCAAARDEFGTPFVLYAAWQSVAAARREGALAARFPQLATQLASLIDQGAIGHPADLPQILSLAEAHRALSGATELADTARRASARIERQIADGAQFERWVGASTMLAREMQRFLLSVLWSDGRPRLVGALRESDRGFLTVAFDTNQVGSWLAARSSDRGRFDATLVVAGENLGSTGFRAGLFPEAPGLDLVLQPSAADPAFQRYRSLLFAGALGAALLLSLVVGYLATRDIAREVHLATQRANFVAGVTHELKTPLTSIRLLAETLRLKRARDSQTADELLAAIVDESERLGHLLDNVLDFASIDRGENIYRPEKIDLGPAVQGALGRLERMVDQAGFRVAVDVEDGNLPVRADPDALDRAVINLISNAMKYSGASQDIHVAIARVENEAQLSVTDHGIGIPPEEQQRIFDRFYRAPEASRMVGGAGLGLALVRHFAEAHGGRVEVSSEPGKGSTFTIALPLAE
jgi:two-component system phosphate regulon sensor histidine kinase PhoR